MTWKYSDGSAVTVAKKYSSNDALYNLISNPCKQAFKSEIGKLEALEFVGKQDDVIASVISKVVTESNRLNLPIEVLNLVIENINWDPGFEQRIKKTAEMRAQVEQANQAALQEAANQQKTVVIATAEKDAAVQRAEADALTYYNTKVAQTLNVEIKLKELEIEKIRAEKWNGVEVYNQSICVPNTYDLKSGK